MPRALGRLFRRDRSPPVPEGHRVVILGAGSSRAQWSWEHADYRTDRPQGAPPPPPLNFDFFAVAGEIDCDWAEETYAMVEEFWSERNGRESLPARLTLEDAFHLVFEAALDAPDDTNSRLLYANCMLLIESVIAATTNPLCRELTGPIAELVYFSAAAPHIARLTLVDFNYDLLVEKAVSRLGHVREDELRFPHVYRLPFFNVESPDEPVPGAADSEYIALLKPHGSLNWMIASQYATQPALVSTLGAERVGLFPRLEVPLDEDGRFDSGAYADLERFEFFTPFIVPPTRAKDRIGSVWLRRQHDAVVDAVRAATEIVVFGYSFPEADPLARSMLEALATRSTPLEKAVVIDLAPTVARLLESRLPDGDVRHETDVHMAIWGGELAP